MKYIIAITFITVLLNCIFNSFFSFVREFDFSLEWIGGTFYFAAVIFILPILISVIVFMLSKKIVIKPVALKYTLQVFVLFLIIQASLFCWAILDMQFYDFDYEYTLKNIIQAYKNAYLVYVLNSILIPVLIVYLDKWYSNRFAQKIS